jgi:phage baseplate assembly protein W
MPVDRSFLGTGWSFPLEFNAASSEVQTVSQEEDIQQSLFILFSTYPGERVMQPGYGCELRSMVFETMTESTETAIKNIIERAVLFFEPRIDLNFIDLNKDNIEQGILNILVDYTVRTTNTRSNIVYPFYFQEGTNIQM